MNYRKKLWKVFAEYIRLRDPWCVTCKHEGKHTRTVHAGHFISRGHDGTRYDETNVHGQCEECNSFKTGNLEIYEGFIIKKYGTDYIKKLIVKSYQYQGFRDPWYKEQIKIYQAKIEELKG
jgi:5-methylcytosine-specific restriction endonuclease McrA